MKPCQVLLSTICVFFSLALFSQTRISGTVTDSTTGNPLVGAIVVAGEKNGTATDINGRYTLTVEAGTQNIRVSYISYIPKTQTVTAVAGQTTPLNFQLQVNENRLNLVVVSAGRFEQKISDVTVSMEVLSPQLIENKNTNTIESIMEQTPGVNMTDGQANIRGGSGFSYGVGSRVLLLVDDMPMLSGDAGDVKWNFMPVENVEQIEVIKGASSALFGSSALNGVIHMRTKYPGLKPQTNITLNSGFYDEPKRASLRWWANANPTYSGINFSHTRRIGENFDLVLGGHVFNDEGYRYLETEQRVRFNANTRYRFKKVEGLDAGVNFNIMRTTGGLFIIWYNDTLAYTPADSSVQNYSNVRYTIDPFIHYFSPKGHRHTLRTRFFRTNNTNDLNQQALADFYFGEYQYQYRFREKLTMTSGIVMTSSVVNSELYNDHSASNIGVYAQFDQRFWDRLSVSLGIRGEYFRVDTATTEYSLVLNKDTVFTSKMRPVMRFGINFQAAEATFIRASYGQGYRFPSIAEKFIRTSASGLEIYPNSVIRPEYGQSAEIGIKQGVKVNKWRGYVDLTAFWMEYKDMIEFNFGQWGSPLIDPLFGLGFKSVNIGHTQITGLDFSVVGQGEIGKTTLALLAGYTYMNPISLDFDPAVDTLFNSSDENILKYRYRHLVKFDAELSWRGFSFGMSMRYNSFMENIDQFFESAVTVVPGIKTYRANFGRNGDLVFDNRILYRINDQLRVALITNNMFNREYASRPADVQAPRNFAVQLKVSF